MPRPGEIVRDANGDPVIVKGYTVTERDGYGNWVSRTVPDSVATYGTFAWVTPRMARWAFVIILALMFLPYFL